LVELMLVMTILVTVIAVAAPTLAGFFRGRALDSEARRLLALTRLGQSQAISGGVPMVLWVDLKERTYGLEEEGGFSEVTTRSFEYRLAEDLTLELLSQNILPPMNPSTVAGFGTLATANAVARLNQARTRGPHRHLPRIRFEPDGVFTTTAPLILRLTDRDGATLCLAPSRHRLNYEIRSQIKPDEEAIR
jgi:type II secretory pathway pseudopilin PulG